MDDAPTPRSAIAQGCQWCGGQFSGGHFHAKMQHPLLAFLVSCSSIWSLSILEHLFVTVTVYCYAPLLIVFQKWYLRVPEECQHHFLLMLHFEFLDLCLVKLFTTCHSNLVPPSFLRLFFIILTLPFHPLLPQVLLRQSTTRCQVGLLSL